MIDAFRLQELINELAELGSDSDPIFLDGKEMTVIDLEAYPSIYTSLQRKFEFFSMKGTGLKVKGTLIQMIIDRGGSGKGIDLEEIAEGTSCPTCGKEGYL